MLYEVPTYLVGCPIGTLNRKTKRKKAMAKTLLIEFGMIKDKEDLFTPYFTIDNQTFRLQSREDEKTAIFFANSLIEAFNKLPNSKTTRIKYEKL